MLISLEWLSDFLDLSDITGLELAERMSRTGIEVESVENIGKDLNNIVVGEVVELAPHQDSDHLNVAQVNVGSSDLSQIVCGAPNIKQGQKVIVALPGAVLPGGMEILESTLRGVDSNGMICSLQELGFSDSVVAKEYAKGIFILPEDAPVGEDIVSYMKLDDDIIELDITPNRADALSMYGTAYEVGAIYNQKPQFNLIEERDFAKDSKLGQVQIEVESPELSNAYQIRLIEDVEVKASPLWVQLRLMKAGIRPVNNIVDTTNYFLLLYGQPMHAFDFDQLESKTLKVKSAAEGDSLTTLDGVERTLEPTDTVIASGDQPIALAGVMGGLDTEVTNNTKNVLLETAVFDSQRVRSTSKKFALRSESSARFEKGINVSKLNESGEQAALLMAQLSGGQIVDGVKEFNQLNTDNFQISVHNNSPEKKLGITLTKEDIIKIIDRLGFEVEFNEEEFIVDVPARRWDISIEADILEEIARIYGYDNIPTTLPTTPSQPGRLTQKQQLIRKTRTVTEGLGLNQAITYVLTSKEHASLLKSDEHSLVELELPMSEERTVLRQSMFPALMEIAQYNQARQNKDLAFYETGRVFFGQGTHVQPKEEERLAILLSGEYKGSQWYESKKNYDFYVLKGMLETYFESLRIASQIEFKSTSEIDVMHPGRTAIISLAGEDIGFMGQIHPLVAEEFDLNQGTFFAEIELDKLVAYPTADLVQTPIAKYPSTSRDLALLVDDTLLHHELNSTIAENGGQYLVSIELFDRYVGENIPEGKQSLAYHMTFQNPNETLKDEDIEKVMTNITDALKDIEGLEIR
ncbi:phenylalanine--tRNA ligase subunit beta [Aerococcaceae bacterium INB8]|uniref:Phenylalanine--tRNA ligase beta subunit n=1 Tax=Ruoffia halotolerans TaxID=2748684 RepID=A0A839A8W9_9LACT|nr:phenylalanine--tRNA ligase subunit beta [Ruoffia halotolerans]MBA5729975.1 phenylalanine--tRNA ligase subunit beta [Ruoffia halotolerans]